MRNFKAKNEHKWANIIDATQDEQEEALLNKSPEFRRNEMIMLEEFRRRKNMKDYWEVKEKHERTMNKMAPEKLDLMAPKHTYRTIGPERYLEKVGDECFDTKMFTLMLMSSDSVTNVTSLNRINHRRVLLFIGNGRGMISYGKGKSDDYEGAMNQAMKKLKANMVCLDWDEVHTSPCMMRGRHNDFYLKIWPQRTPNYWGNPIIWKMLLATGFKHCRYQCKSRERDPYSLIYAFFAAVTQTKTCT